MLTIPIRFLTELGQVFIFMFQTLLLVLKPPYRVSLLFRSMQFVGVGSLFIVVLTGTFSGAVMTLQGLYAFGMINQEPMVGASVALALTRELSPVLAALMVSGRAGSAMATELGTMRVTEQIDAMETMSVNPIQYLVVPRVVASATMMPMLTILFTMVGMAGTYFVAVTWHGVDLGLFMQNIRLYVSVDDIYNGLYKSIFFGLTFSVIACYKGFHAGGGARGVGLATTGSVVMSSVMIFVMDYALTAIMF